MADGSNPVFFELEQSLINFLCSKRDIEEKISGGIRRVRSLSFSINAKIPKAPYFTVQIGMVEAGFNAITGLKERGSCYGLERYIRDWFERPTVKFAIQKYIESQTKNKK